MRLAATAAAFMVCFTMPARGEMIAGEQISVVDADTVDVPCQPAAPGCRQRIRLAEIEAPEIDRPHCDAERQLGLAAANRMREILHGHPVTITRRGRRDPLRRTTLADLSTDEGGVAEMLLQEGLALPFESGAEAKARRIAHWCRRAQR